VVNVLLLVISSILMLVGLFGIIIPFIPGVPLVWLGLFIYAIGTGFRTIPIPAVIIFFFLMVATLVIDFLLPLLGIKKNRASNWSIPGSFLGFLVGVILFNIWGAILGPIVGAFLGELIARREFKSGLNAALGALIGSIVGTILKLVVSLGMIGYFIWTFF
jgi:uncharacterized protein